MLSAIAISFRKSFLLAAVFVSVVICQLFIGSEKQENFYAPDFNKKSFGATIPPIINRPSLTDTQEVNELILKVKTILAHNCNRCHGSDKAEGELRLDEGTFIDNTVVVAGKPGQSELIRRIKLSPGDIGAMPATGTPLTKDEIDLLEYWVKAGAPWSDEKPSIYPVASLVPRMPAIPSASGDLINPVDRFVNVYFKQHNISWKKVIDDRLFIRRVYMDVIGLLPHEDSVDAFVKNKNAEKRVVLVKNLLNNNDAYAQHWLTFWNDALRNDYSGTGYITGGRSDITGWLYNSLRYNKPYDIFVKQLINPDSASHGFIQGITWRGTINASQRVEMQAAQNISQVFLGLNLKCASCHDSFISDWKLEDAYAFANIFSDTTLEINRCDKPTGKFAGRRILFKELGQIDSGLNKQQRLQQLSELLVQPKNGRLYRTLVNRIWAQLMGRGIIEPVDEMDKQPWSQDLLDWLAADFANNGYDVKKLLFTILTSRTYQLPSVPVADPAKITSANFIFAGALRRRITAEEFSDAVSQTIDPVYSDSAIVYHLLPSDSKKNIPFARASVVVNDPFLTALGRPNRETVSTSRVSQASLLQALELTNGIQFNAAIRRGAEKWKMRYSSSEQLVKTAYRKMLGRLPLKSEEKTVLKMLGTDPSVEDIGDFLWGMALHPEFQLIY